MALFQRFQKAAIAKPKLPFPETAEEIAALLAAAPTNPLASDEAANLHGYDPRYPYPSAAYSITNLYKGERRKELNALNAGEKQKYMFQNEPLYAIYTPDTLLGASDGVYLWIYSTLHGFYAIRSYSTSEIGTKHFALTRRVREALGLPVLKFRYAGELEKKGTELTFNLLSGSFMAYFMNDLLDKYEKSPGVLSRLNAVVLAQAEKELQAVLGAKGFVVKASDTPMATRITANLSEAEIVRLQQRGYNVKPKPAGGSRGRRHSRRLHGSKKPTRKVTQRRRRKE